MIWPFAVANLRCMLRDRMFQAVAVVALVLLLVAPVLSVFSMRQQLETCLMLCLSTHALFMLVIAMLLGSSLVWRDIEKKYTHSLLTLPCNRSHYLFGKFLAVALLLAACSAAFFVLTVVICHLFKIGYGLDAPLAVTRILAAVFSDYVKFVLEVSIALALSLVSTSIYLPFFCSLVIYIGGSSSQEVIEFIRSDLVTRITPIQATAAQVVYYLIPNFALLDNKAAAIYPILFDSRLYWLSLVYAMVYIALVMLLAVSVFNRREFP